MTNIHLTSLTQQRVDNLCPGQVLRHAGRDWAFLELLDCVGDRQPAIIAYDLARPGVRRVLLFSHPGAAVDIVGGVR